MTSGVNKYAQYLINLPHVLNLLKLLKTVEVSKDVLIVLLKVILR
jgi:hypothetical protein